MKMFKFILLLVIVVEITACNNQPKKSDGDPIRLIDVKANPKLYKGKKVRWAGNIVKVANNRKNTVVEVLGKRLDMFGSANHRGAEEGRFYAIFPGFKDPAQFAKGKLLLVNARFIRLKSGKIGAYKYVYPEVMVQSHKLSDKPGRYGDRGPIWHWGWWWGYGHHHGHGSHIGWGWGY